MSGGEKDRFLEMMAAEHGVSLNTITAYDTDITQFLEFGKFTKPDDINSSVIEKFLIDLKNRCFTPKSIARKLSAIKEFCLFLYSEKIISQNPAQNILTPKQEKPLPKFLTEDEIKCMADAAFKSSDYRMQRIGVMIELMYATGLRVSELVGLPENAVNYEKKILTVLGKGSKERIVPIADKAVQILWNYLSLRREFIKKNTDSLWLFPSLTSTCGHLTRDAFFKDIKKLAVQCGIFPSRVFPHVLRHSFATHLINNDADLRSVQKMLGHENITTTEIYTHITSKKIHDTVNQKHPLAHLKEIPDD